MAAAWSVSGARTPLIAMVLTLIGVFLPWAGSMSLASLIGWVLPVIATLLVVAATIMFVTTDGHPAWLGMVAAGLSFVMAVLASVVMAAVLVFAHAANAVLSIAAEFGGGHHHVGVSVGGWLTVAATVAAFLGTLRLLLARSQVA